jgi:hypothetical protein
MRMADAGTVSAPIASSAAADAEGVVREENRDTSPISGPKRVKGVVHVPAERGEEGVEEFGAELFLLVVAGEEDLMTEAETVYEAEKGVGGRTHRREDNRDM